MIGVVVVETRQIPSVKKNRNILKIDNNRKHDPVWWIILIIGKYKEFGKKKYLVFL